MGLYCNLYIYVTYRYTARTSYRTDLYIYVNRLVYLCYISLDG